MRPVRLVALAALLLVLSPVVARASSYKGYGETQWGYTNKAYCCEDAVSAAQDDSARACERAGGYAEFRGSSARGRCDWDTKRGNDGRAVYRCTATASVSCH